MKERGQEVDSYWQIDLAVGEGQIHGEQYAIRLRVHTSTEPYRGGEGLVKLVHTHGERTYFHARPYILVPEITLTIGVYDRPTGQNQIGEVIASEWEGMKQQEIGSAQAWYYPKDRLLIFWECYLHESFRTANPCEDENLAAVYGGFEKLLLERLEGVERIAVPSWEPIYPENDWQEFLRQQGYRRFNKQAFLKEVAKGCTGFTT